MLQHNIPSLFQRADTRLHTSLRLFVETRAVMLKHNLRDYGGWFANPLTPTLS